MRHFKGGVFKEKIGNKTYWIARVTVTDIEGKRRNLRTSAPTKTEARQKLDTLKQKAKNIAGGATVNSERMTFIELAEKYEELKITPPRYIKDRKVAGMRSYEKMKGFLKPLTLHFGKRLVKSIRHSDVEAFKRRLIETPTRSGGQRSIAAVNRPLQLLRSIFIWAARQGWIEKNPFDTGERLIDKSAEVKRDRILSFEEEERLIAACEGPRAHLKPLVIAAIDTGMRRGELFKLTWADVDLANHRITIRAKNAKTGKARQAIITDRLADELRRLGEFSNKQPSSLVFGLKVTIKTAWASACKEAQIEDLRFHDLRHVFITRTATLGILPTVTMKLAGHETLDMHARYLNPNDETADQVREALNGLYQSRAIQTSELIH